MAGIGEALMDEELLASVRATGAAMEQMHGIKVRYRRGMQQRILWSIIGDGFVQSQGIAENMFHARVEAQAAVVKYTDGRPLL